MKDKKYFRKVHEEYMDSVFEAEFQRTIQIALEEFSKRKLSESIKRGKALAKRKNEQSK